MKTSRTARIGSLIENDEHGTPAFSMPAKFLGKIKMSDGIKTVYMHHNEHDNVINDLSHERNTSSNILDHGNMDFDVEK